MKKLFIFILLFCLFSCGAPNPEEEEIPKPDTPVPTASVPASPISVPTPSPGGLPEEVISPEFVSQVIDDNKDILFSCVPHTMPVSIDWTIGEDGYPKKVLVTGKFVDESLRNCLTEKMKTIFFDFSLNGKRFVHKYILIVGDTVET